jgi:plastocyanin
MPRLPAILACLALAAGVVAGCGDNGDTASTTPAPPPPPPAASSASSGDVVNVTMKNIKFVPAAVTAKVGQKIEWKNTDGNIPHTVTSTTDGVKFDSGTLQPGSTFDFTPTKAGKIDYVCTIHSGQTGTITVTK